MTPGKPKKRIEPEPRPDVEVGDHLFVHHGGQACSGNVRAHGQHGVTVDIDGKHQKVRWDKVLGHKQRTTLRYSVLEQGEDGMLVKDGQGRRRFVGVPNEAKEDPMVVKSIGAAARPILLFVKAAPPGAPRAGLTRKQLTDKNGHQTTRMVRTNKEQPGEKRGGHDEDAGAEKGYGTHNLQAGDTVEFSAGDFSGSGKIVGSPGADGAHIKDASGRTHQVRWSEVTGHDDKGGADKPKVKNEVRGKQEPIAADQFKASDYAREHDDAAVTSDAILAGFPPDTGQKIADVQQRLSGIEQTIGQYKKDGVYTDERTELHFKIIGEILSPQRIEAATPAEGVAPTFTVLGGRGGSGKSWFNGKVYDESKAIVLDADHIKSQLPEYEGWNAAQVHEESGDIFDEITSMCARLGLNVVHDKTMKTARTTLNDLGEFKKLGYRTEAHYMHLPRQEAAKRAVARFLGKTNRYVPVDVVLSNTGNEATFDEVRKVVDKWSFRDNNVAQGQEPILISESEGGAAATHGDESQGKKGGALMKSDQGPMIVLWRTRT